VSASLLEVNVEVVHVDGPHCRRVAALLIRLGGGRQLAVISRLWRGLPVPGHLNSAVRFGCLVRR
jgi:hypothetical protein